MGNFISLNGQTIDLDSAKIESGGRNTKGDSTVTKWSVVFPSGRKYYLSEYVPDAEGTAPAPTARIAQAKPPAVRKGKANPAAQALATPAPVAVAHEQAPIASPALDVQALVQAMLPQLLAKLGK
jgi:hypothetical protein